MPIVVRIQRCVHGTYSLHTKGRCASNRLEVVSDIAPYPRLLHQVSLDADTLTHALGHPDERTVMPVVLGISVFVEPGRIRPPPSKAPRTRHRISCSCFRATPMRTSPSALADSANSVLICQGDSPSVEGVVLPTAAGAAALRTAAPARTRCIASGGTCGPAVSVGGGVAAAWPEPSPGLPSPPFQP